MSHKLSKKGLQIALLAVGIVVAAPVALADGANAPGSKSAASGINLAGLAAVLQAASDRKQAKLAVTEIVLKKDVYLQGRPTGDAAKSGVVTAGTLVRRSNKQVVNANGTWRHIETGDGRDGWMHELDLLDP